MEQKYNSSLQMWKQGAINGLMLGTTLNIILLSLGFIERYLNTTNEPGLHIQTFNLISVEGINFIYLPLVCLLLVSISSGLSSQVLSPKVYPFIKWQFVGIISVLILFTCCLILNLFDYILSPNTYKWKFAESLNISMWIFSLLTVSIFNFFYVLVLRLIHKVNAFI